VIFFTLLSVVVFAILNSLVYRFLFLKPDHQTPICHEQVNIESSDDNTEKSEFAPLIHKVNQLDLLLASACERLMNSQAKNGITAQVQVVHESRGDLDKIESILKLLRGQPDEDVKQDDQTIEKIPDNVISLFNPK